MPSVIWAVAAGLAVAGLAQTNRSTQLSLPPAVDLRPQFEAYGLGRNRQGNRPTCSVFTVVGALEFAIAKRQGHCPRLSVEFLNWAANQVAGDTHDGGFFSDLWKGFAAYGICAEAEFPYQDKFDPKRRPPPEALTDAQTRLGLGLRWHWIKEWNVHTGLTESQLEAIKDTLHRGWPVCGGFRWPKQEQWVDSVLQMCPSNAVRDGHSVLLVGYRDDPNRPGHGVFIFRNTSRDGRDGQMPYEYARAYMNDAGWIDFESRVERAASAAGPGPALLNDLLGPLIRLPAGCSRRISSNQQPLWHDANLDMTVLPPGRAVELPVLEGPGVITHMWFTSHAGRVNELDALSLRIYWDGQAEPAVEAPLGMFFGVGQGSPAPLDSLPVQVSASGALSCYWRMPFERSARIVISNDNPDRTAGLYWQVDWVELEALPPGTPYFHAQYRQEYPAASGQEYLVAELEGSGAYVGTVLCIALGQDGWWGEGDDFFYVDGEPVPSLQGTGSEDYFNDAWGFRPRISPWFGQPRWQGDQAGDSGVCYRWHLLDPVLFRRSLKVAFEHKGNRPDDTEGFYLERPDFLSSVAFWYQVGPAKRFSRLPPYPERRVPWEQHHLVRAFRQARATGPAQPRIDFAGMFGARPVLSWTNTVPGARLSVPFSLQQAGRYAVRLTAVAGPGYGTYAIELDGQTVLAQASFGAPDFQELDLALGTHQLAAGAHELALRALPLQVGPAGPVAIELVRLLRLPPEATRPVKTHHEAHFIRLAIGRAVYAYRLAYDQVPESLDALVQAGLLPVRYLADENLHPLRSWRDGDALVVESTGPGGWTHRWLGLDARR